jgi:small subunit ribosomal protein S27e
MNAFAKVRCNKCKNEQVIFTRAVQPVACLVCGATIASPRGGKSHVDAQVLEVYG